MFKTMNIVPATLSALALSTAMLAATLSPSQARQGGHHPASYGHARHHHSMAGHHMGHHGRYADGGHGFGYTGIGIGAGLAGLAAGAMLDNSFAADVADAGPDDAVAYCSDRFKSYDPSSGTYLGYDGNEHACP